MSTHTLDALALSPSSRYVLRKQENLLAAHTEELASLRFSILLTARWEAATDEDVDHRDELRTELEGLRREYYGKIDEIAMSFGVQNAMNAQQEVERSVRIPSDMEPKEAVDQQDYLNF